MLSIIIVGWNCAADVVLCLESIERCPPTGPFEVIFVDNASSDASVERIGRQFPAVRILANNRNVGFQRANNQALAVATGSEVVLLNPDTQVLPGALDTLVAFLRQHPDVGAVSPRCVYPDGGLQWTMAPFPSLPIIRHWFWRAHPVLAKLAGCARRATAPVDPGTGEQAYAYGACFAVKRAVIDQVGPMDERFFLAGGEVAWCREMQARGWKAFYVAEATIVHRESVSRMQRSWVTELDWVQAHRRLLYVYEGIGAGLAGDLYFSLHLCALVARRAVCALTRRASAAGDTRRSTA